MIKDITFKIFHENFNALVLKILGLKINRNVLIVVENIMENVIVDIYTLEKSTLVIIFVVMKIENIVVVVYFYRGIVQKGFQVYGISWIQVNNRVICLLIFILGSRAMKKNNVVFLNNLLNVKTQAIFRIEVN